MVVEKLSSNCNMNSKQRKVPSCKVPKFCSIASCRWHERVDYVKQSGRIGQLISSDQQALPPPLSNLMMQQQLKSFPRFYKVEPIVFDSFFQHAYFFIFSMHPNCLLIFLVSKSLAISNKDRMENLICTLMIIGQVITGASIAS